MARRIELKKAEDGFKDDKEAVEFSFRDVLLTSATGVPVKSLLLMGDAVEASNAAEASGDESDASGSFAAFKIQYKLALSLLEPKSRAIFVEMVETSDPAIDVEDLSTITTRIMEELLGNDPVSSGHSSDTTSSTEPGSTDLLSAPGSGTLLSLDQLPVS